MRSRAYGQLWLRDKRRERALGAFRIVSEKLLCWRLLTAILGAVENLQGDLMAVVADLVTECPSLHTVRAWPDTYSG